VRFSELEPGQEYVLLRGHKPRRVTVLETPEDVRRRGLVRVRSEDGVTRGRVVDQQLRFIKSRWGEAPAESAARRPRMERRPGRWPPEPGDRVRWPCEAGEIEWTVSSVDLPGGTAVLEGRLFSIHQTATAPLNQLDPIALEVETYDDQAEVEPVEPPPVRYLRDSAAPA
jgi:hypothetical protein